jgi:hypothetical protein
MNKGARVIDNIAALKFCKENHIKNIYNLLVGYPNEEQQDFDETRNTVQILKTFLDAPQLCELRLMQGSALYRHPKRFNIDHLEYASIDQIMFPAEYLGRGISFVYDFKPLISPQYFPWEKLVEEWKKEQQTAQLRAISEQNQMDQFVFYFVDGGSFMKIYDKRDRQNIKIHVLNELERTVFLSCIDIISFKELQRRFLDVPEFELAAILQSFEKNGIVYVEDDSYLSLPLRCHLVNTQDKKEECLVNISP